jgi:hypothetical protein
MAAQHDPIIHCASTSEPSTQEAGYERLLAEAERELHLFLTADGTVVLTAPAHIVTATKPRR